MRSWACSAASCRSASITRRSTGRAASWQHLFERPIRIMAGLGKLKPGAPHKYYDKAYLFADVLVIGGGPAGLEAAIAAAEAGADTLLIDDWRAARRLAALQPRRRRPRQRGRAARRARAARQRPAQPAHHDRHDRHRHVRRQLGVGHARQPLLQDPQQADGDRHRRLRSAARVPQQRPPRHHVRRRGAAADAPLRREARHARRHRHVEPLRLRGGARSARRGHRRGRRCRSQRHRRQRCRRKPCGRAACASFPAQRWSIRKGRKRVSSVAVSRVSPARARRRATASGSTATSC